jgi:hypothetical protein
MTIAPPRLAATPAQVRDSLGTFNEVMESRKDRLKESLIQIISYVHSWICVFDEETGEPQFGPSKFVGYRDMTPDIYSEHFKLMNGRETERVLEPWVRLVTEADANYDDLHRKLHEFCGRFGTKPRARCRISILTMEADRRVDDSGRDAALVELLVKVCETLPAERRQEIARRIARR